MGVQREYKQGYRENYIRDTERIMIGVKKAKISVQREYK